MIEAAPPDPARVRKILVRSTNWIGDVVMISPALAALRKRFPEARIEVVALPHLAECFEGNPSVDAVIPFDRRGRDRGALGLIRFSRSLRSRGYDLAVLFQKAIGAALMARLAGIPLRVGIAADSRAWLLTHPVVPARGRSPRHHLDLFSDVAIAAGCDASDRTPFFPVLPDDLAFADALLAEEKADRFDFLVGLHVGASKPPRAWHLDRFIESVRRIAGPRRAGVILLGGRGEKEAMSKVASALGGAAIDACGRTTIRQMAALISRCRLLLANDSGPMHLAGALGVSVVAIFGPGDPDRTAPVLTPPRPEAGPADAARVGATAGTPPPVRSVGAAAISRRYPCAPCRQDFFRECYPSPAGKPMCLEAIGVEEVVSAASTLLD